MRDVEETWVSLSDAEAVRADSSLDEMVSIAAWSVMDGITRETITVAVQELRQARGDGPVGYLQGYLDGLEFPAFLIAKIRLAAKHAREEVSK